MKCECHKNLNEECKTEEGFILARCKLCQKPYTFSVEMWNELNEVQQTTKGAV